MPWLHPIPIPAAAQDAFGSWLGELRERLSDPTEQRALLVRDLLAQLHFGESYTDLEARAPLLALQLDPRNVTLEAEHYQATDPSRFAAAKPLLWLWKGLDRSPAGQNAAFAIPLRRLLAEFLFKRVGKNFKAWEGVEFSVGYNLEVGDDVVIHRHVLLDDIGGLSLGDGVSVSDYANIYSHTHSVLDAADVTLLPTRLGRGVRVAYHATVLAGSLISDDAMVAAGAVVTRGVPPHGIAMGVPARTTRYKLRPACGASYAVDSRRDRVAASKGNPDFPEPTGQETEPASQMGTPGELKSRCG
jgi:acetyltransferase-like isoleucine patch superfamily enzyme